MSPNPAEWGKRWRVSVLPALLPADVAVGAESDVKLEASCGIFNSGAAVLLIVILIFWGRDDREGGDSYYLDELDR